MEQLTLLVHLTDNADEMQFANLLSIYNTKCTLLSAAYAMLTVAFTKKKPHYMYIISKHEYFHQQKWPKVDCCYPACWFVKLRMVMFVYEYEDQQDLLYSLEQLT